MINNIYFNDISVVVQGVIDPIFTPICLNSIRKHLPEAEIILSTWKGETIKNLDYDILILNDDPGAFIYTSTNKVQNQNRQIVSTRNGILNASRKYVLKIRTDMQILGTKFLTFWNKYPY